MNTKELKELINGYGILNAEKNDLADKVKGMGDDIKEAFEEMDITEFTTDGYVAKVGVRVAARLNVERVCKALGIKEIPTEWYDYTEVAVLNVKARKGVAKKTA